MITTPVFVFATVAFSAACSFGAPIKVRRDGSEVQQIGRRFPQTIAADSPVLVKKEVETSRRVYHDYYTKRATPDVTERSPAPESVPEVRSIADEASDDLAARKRRRETRRSTSSTHFKRTLLKDGVRSRREEPKMKRSVVSQSVVVAREPEPVKASVPPLEKRNSMTSVPVIESRAFIPPASPAIVAARDTFIWNVNAGGIKVEEFTDVKQTQKINGSSLSGSTSPSSVGSTDPSATPTESQPNSAANSTSSNETQTPPCNENSPTTAGTGEEGSSTSTASDSKTTSSPTSSGNSSQSGNPSSSTVDPCTETTTQQPSSQKNPPAMNVSQNNPQNADGTSEGTPRNDKRDEEPPSPKMRRGSAKWRRIVPAPSLRRRASSAPSVVQFKR